MTYPVGDATSGSPEPSNSNTVGMPLRPRNSTMPQNTNSFTLPGSSAIGGYAAFPSGSPDGGLANAGYVDFSGTPVDGAVRVVGSGSQPTSVINMTNSSDVVIGPMTQYQGSVTIYQYMDATFDSSNAGIRGAVRAGEAAGRPGKIPEVPKRCGIFNITTRQKLTILILFINIIALIVGAYFGLKYIGSASHPLPDSYRTRDIRFSRDYQDENIVPSLGNGHLIIDRNQWGASESRLYEAPRLQRPAPHVIITHVGVQSVPCDSVYKCSIRMRSTQDSTIVEKSRIDLNANFYVSNDGYVYVGRGWEYQNYYSNQSIAICFMGDYIRFKPSASQLEAAQYLIEYGMQQQHLRPDYLMVAHNQTAVTKSPGFNVYKEIIKWPHWYSGCGVDEKPLCDW